ncbi:MAG: TetR/AcrR family transcriptional regulator, partial [Microbacterium sp.]
MGRTRTFDESDATRSALGVFWGHGFDGAAVPDLERATGLSRSSIYHAFGSKRGLFDAAVSAYLDQVVRPRLAPLQADAVASGALAEYLRGLRHVMAEPTLPLAAHGCLLLNAATAPVGTDEGLRQVIREYREELAAAMQRGAEAARPDLDAASVAALATACTAHVVAAMTLVRVDSDGACEL